MRALVALLVLPALALIACGGPENPPGPRGAVRIATGNRGGVYAVYGDGLAGIVRGRFPSTAATTIATGGSVDNIDLICAGRAEAGFTLADVAADAVNGAAPFAESRPIVALARLYDNYVQLVVRADGPVRTLADLAGRRISVGAEGSGTAVVGERILKIAGLTGDVEISRMEVGPSAQALAARRIDAFFWSGGLPSAAINDLRRETAVRLIDLGSIAGSLTREYGELYTETTVPASVYGLAGAVATVGVPNYLVVHRDMPAATAYWLTRLLFEQQPRLAELHPEARRLDPGAAIMTYPLDLHPGAVRWYREHHR